MIKISAIFYLLTIALPALAQEKLLDILPLQDGIVTYTGVVQVDSANKNALYTRAKKWFVITYKSAKEVIQLDDKENGEITGKGEFKIMYYSREPYISHTISILVKDGRYKYILTSISYADNQNEKFAIENFPKGWFGKKKLYATVDQEVKSTILSLQAFMKKNVNNDW